MSLQPAPQSRPALSIEQIPVACGRVGLTTAYRGRLRHRDGEERDDLETAVILAGVMVGTKSTNSNADVVYARDNLPAREGVLSGSASDMSSLITKRVKGLLLAFMEV